MLSTYFCYVIKFGARTPRYVSTLTRGSSATGYDWNVETDIKHVFMVNDQAGLLFELKYSKYHFVSQIYK